MKEEQGCKPHYINDLLKVFKTFFRYCTEEEYDTTKDIKQAQAAAGHTPAAMTLRHHVKGRHQRTDAATPIAAAYGLKN